MVYVKKLDLVSLYEMRKISILDIEIIYYHTDFLFLKIKANFRKSKKSFIDTKINIYK
jgi:hypothetical protein